MPPVMKEIPEGPATMVLDEEEIGDDNEMVSLQRRRRRRASTVHPEDMEGLFRESELT